MASRVVKWTSRVGKGVTGKWILRLVTQRKMRNKKRKEKEKGKSEKKQKWKRGERRKKKEKRE